MHRRCDRGIGRLSLNVTCFKKRSLHGCRPATIRQSGKHCSALSAIPRKEVTCSRISIIAYGNIKSSVSKLLFYFFFLSDLTGNLRCREAYTAATPWLNPLLFFLLCRRLRYFRRAAYLLVLFPVQALALSL